MATTKPRITITLEPRQYEVLKAIREVSGFDMASIIRDLISASEPVLVQTAIALQKVKSATDAQKVEMAKVIEASQAKYEPILAAGLDQLDMFFGQVRDVVGGEEVAAPTCKGGVGTSKLVTKPSVKRKRAKRIPA